MVAARGPLPSMGGEPPRGPPWRDGRPPAGGKCYACTATPPLLNMAWRQACDIAAFASTHPHTSRAP